MVGRIHLAPAEPDPGHHRLGIEDGERGGDHLARHLTHDRAPAREVGRAVRELHAVGQRARAGREAERGVGGVALGREVHLAGHGLQRHGQLSCRRSAQLGHNCHPRSDASLYRLIRDDGRRPALAPPFPGPVAHAPGRGRDDLGGAGRALRTALLGRGRPAGRAHQRGRRGWRWAPLFAWFLRRRFRAWRYQERHEDLIVARGVMVQRLSVVPYGRMQFVEVTAGPVERLFQLSTVKLHTAAAASDARIPGLGAGRGGAPAGPADRAGRVDGGGHVTDGRRPPPAPPPEPTGLVAGSTRSPPSPASAGSSRPSCCCFLVSTVHSKAENGTVETDYLIAFTLLSALYGYIHWMVTRWRFEGDTLRIETGLIRKDSRRLPLARIQAVDIVRPLLARLLGVSELRIRLAGSGGTDGKLAYLSEAQAAELRLVLLAGHIDTEARRSSNTGLPMASVDTARLLASVFLSLVTIVVIGTVAALAVLDQFEPKTAAGRGGVPRRLPAQRRRRDLAPAVGPVQLHRRGGARGGAHPARPAADHLRDGPLRPDPGGAPGGAAAVAAVRLVPPGGRRGRGDGAQPARRGHQRRAQGAAAGRIATGLLAPAGAPARRARPGAHGPAGAGPVQGAAELPLPVGRPRRQRTPSA